MCSRPIYGKDDARRRFHFSIRLLLHAIVGMILSKAFDTVYFIPEKGGMATRVDDSLSAGDEDFEATVAGTLKDYKTHKPDRGSVQFAGITAKSDAAGIIQGIRPIDVPARSTDRFPSGKEPALAGHQATVGGALRPPRRPHQRDATLQPAQLVLSGAQ